MLWNEEIPRKVIKDDIGRKSTVKVINGTFGDTTSPSPAPDSFASNEDNYVAVWLIEMEANAELELPTADASANRSIYCFDGDDIQLDERELGNGLMAKLRASETTKLKNGSDTAKFLFLQGKPIGEPVAQYGPFVMNTQDEIRQTMMDYQRTQFGGWPWPSPAHTHSPEKGRFALHADGKLEVKG